MKKALTLFLALVLITTSMPTSSMAAVKSKVFAFDLTETNLFDTNYNGPTEGFISVVRQVVIILDDWTRTISPYSGTLYYDSSVKFASITKVFKNAKIPDGTLGAVIRLDGKRTAVIPTNIRTWDDFRKHVIGLPEEVADSLEPPAEWPIATRTNIVQANSPNQAAAIVLKELQQLVQENVSISVTETYANAVARYVSVITAIVNGKTITFYQLAYGAKAEGFNCFFVEKASKQWAEWEGYIGTPEQAAKYILSKTKKK